MARDSTQNALIEQPAVALFSEPARETSSRFHEFEQAGGSSLVHDVLLPPAVLLSGKVALRVQTGLS